MVSRFTWPVAGATLVQLGAELSWLIAAVVLAIRLLGEAGGAGIDTILPAVLFAVVMVSLNGAFGLYRRDHKLSFGIYVSRLFLALLIGAPVAYLISEVLPGGETFQHTLGAAVMNRFTELNWAARDSAPGSRVVNFTRTGEKRFAALFGASESDSAG